MQEGQTAEVRPEDAAEPALIDMASLKAVAQRYFWKGRVPLGAITIIEGDPGTSKSLVTMDLAARASRGALLPDETRSDLDGPVPVIIIACEDDPASVIKPRLIAAGADVTLVKMLQGTAQPNKKGVRPFNLRDLETLEKALQKGRGPRTDHAASATTAV